MNTLKYKGYTATIDYIPEDKLLVGHLAGIRDIVSFHAESAKDIEQAFHEAVDDYLDMCEKLGDTPNKPYSGKFELNIPPELHAALANKAAEQGLSVNTMATKAIENLCSK